MSVTQLEKLQRTLPEVFGQLALLMQHKAMLQATANTNGLPRCRTATTQCSVIITRLRHNIQARNDETSPYMGRLVGVHQTVEIQTTHRQATTVNSGITTAPSGVAPDPLTLDGHPAPPMACLVDTGAPPQRRVPQSSCSCANVCWDTVTPPQREQGYHSVRNSITDSGPPFTSDLYAHGRTWSVHLSGRVPRQRHTTLRPKQHRVKHC